METMGRRIARFRKARGLTQAALAAQVGTSKAYIAQLEGDWRTNPGKDLCDALATALDVTLDELIRGTSPNAQRAASTGSTSAEVAALLAS